MYLLEQGKTLEEIALFLGHESVSSVLDYVTLTSSRRRRILREHDPKIPGRKPAYGRETPPLRELLLSLRNPAGVPGSDLNH